MKNFIKISPVGGVGQIGSNCTLIQTPKVKLLIDCGILFPRESVFDLNYLIPNLEKLSDIDIIIITHGHEDHIGAIVHYIQAFPSAKIYAPLFARELILYKLEQAKMTKEIFELETLDLEDINIKSIHVNHSIPNTKGLIISSEKLDCSITFISDFKIDPSLIYEPLFDFSALSEQSKYKRRIALLDSTNILSKNTSTPSENDIISPLKEIIQSCVGTTYLTTFASNIFRIQSVINIAHELGRVVIAHGRSMERYIEIALKTGFLTDPGILRTADDQSVKKRKLSYSLVVRGNLEGPLKELYQNKILNIN